MFLFMSKLPPATNVGLHFLKFRKDRKKLLCLKCYAINSMLRSVYSGATERISI